MNEKSATYGISSMQILKISLSTISMTALASVIYLSISAFMLSFGMLDNQNIIFVISAAITILPFLILGSILFFHSISRIVSDSNIKNTENKFGKKTIFFLNKAIFIIWIPSIILSILSFIVIYTVANNIIGRDVYTFAHYFLIFPITLGVLLFFVPNLSLAAKGKTR